MTPICECGAYAVTGKNGQWRCDRCSNHRPKVGLPATAGFKPKKPVCPNCKHEIVHFSKGDECCSINDNHGCSCRCWEYYKKPAKLVNYNGNLFHAGNEGVEVLTRKRMKLVKPIPKKPAKPCHECGYYPKAGDPPCDHKPAKKHQDTTITIAENKVYLYEGFNPVRTFSEDAVPQSKQLREMYNAGFDAGKEAWISRDIKEIEIDCGRILVKEGEFQIFLEQLLEWSKN